MSNLASSDPSLQQHISQFFVNVIEVVNVLCVLLVFVFLQVAADQIFYLPVELDLQVDELAAVPIDLNFELVLYKANLVSESDDASL